MTKSLALWILAAVVVVGGGFFVANTYAPSFGNSSVGTTTDSTGRYLDIQAYVRANIILLSPVKSQYGGTFYVTTIETNGGTGVVHYEDGHTEYIADFTYTADDNGKPSVTSFVFRK